MSTSSTGSSSNLLQSPSHHQQHKHNRNTRRSLRERLRDGVNTVSTGVNPFQQSSKSKSIDSSTPASNLYQQTTTAAMDFLSTPFELINKLKSSSHELYTVQPNDTLTSIAANYESTPSELIKLNKLGSRLVFPGQVLKIPVNKSQRVAIDKEEEKKDDFASRKFIKLGVRHVTDGNGVISGTLLVTPNAVMFDPNVSDPLVIEQGAEVYGVILPFELIAAAGIYNDISGMRVKGIPESGLERGDVLIYPPPGGGHDGGGITALPVFDEAPSANTNAGETPPAPSTSPRRTQSSSSSSPPVTYQAVSGQEDIKSKVLKRLSFPLTWSPFAGEESGEKSKYRSLVSLEDVPDLRASFEKLLPSHHSPTPPSPNPLRPIPAHSSSSYASFPTSTSDSETWFLCLTTGYNPGNKPKLGHMVSYGSKTQCKPEYWFGVNNMAEVDELYRFWMLWWPHLYGGVDAELIASRGMTLVDWDTNIFEECSPTPLQHQSSTAAEMVGDLGKESWEMLKAPYTKLYSFIRTGLSSTSSSTDLEWGSALDFFDVTCDPEEQSKVVSMTEELHRLLNTSSEYDHYVPELLSPSEILKEADVEAISRHLTARAQGYPWHLIFSSTKHGFSLSTLYRRMEEVENSSPVLVVVEDTRGEVFGSLLSTPLRLSDHFYGTGQSFLFQLRGRRSEEEAAHIEDKNDNDKKEDDETPKEEPPEEYKPSFKLYKWTGENNYFIKGNLESVSVGAGDGHFGLWLDSDLFVGRTEHCSTYNNPPLVEEKDFVVKTMECWGFGGGGAGEER